MNEEIEKEITETSKTIKDIISEPKKSKKKTKVKKITPMVAEDFKEIEPMMDECDWACDIVEPYWFVPEAGCKIHDIDNRPYSKIRYIVNFGDAKKGDVVDILTSDLPKLSKKRYKLV